MLPECEITDAFRSYTLPVEGNVYEQLLRSVWFEELGKGRQGAVLVKPHDRCIPIVRTTTKYSRSAQYFRPVYEQLAEQFQQSASLPFRFNNALIETYTNAYATMGSHSDQALDLAEESHIAVFSCYEHPERANPSRKLIVESKEPGGAAVDIPLTHNSVVVFSVATNRLLKHKIVLANPAPENRWLGITFRTSKTLVRLRDGHAYFLDGTPVTLADDEQRLEFYQLRGRENKETDFRYPRITYTISESDLMQPAD